MTLYQKRLKLQALKNIQNKLHSHLNSLRITTAALTEEIRQEELELYILTNPNPITYIQEGKCTKTITPFYINHLKRPASSKEAKKYLNAISNLSIDSKQELIIYLRQKMEETPTTI